MVCLYAVVARVVAFCADCPVSCCGVGRSSSLSRGGSLDALAVTHSIMHGCVFSCTRSVPAAAVPAVCFRGCFLAAAVLLYCAPPSSRRFATRAPTPTASLVCVSAGMMCGWRTPRSTRKWVLMEGGCKRTVVAVAVVVVVVVEVRLALASPHPLLTNYSENK